MDGLERLVAIEEICAVTARYARTMDTKDWGGYRSVLSDDMVLDISATVDEGYSGPARFEGGDVVVELTRSFIGDAASVHQLHAPEIEIISDVSARAVWALEDRLFYPRTDDADARDFHGWGHYHVEYIKVDGRWRMRSLTLTRLTDDVVPADLAADQIGR
jgi:hypothetical protein